MGRHKAISRFGTFLYESILGSRRGKTSEDKGTPKLRTRAFCSYIWRWCSCRATPLADRLQCTQYSSSSCARQPPADMISNQVFTAFSFLGFLLCVIPLPWHLEGKHLYFASLVISTNCWSVSAWNTGTCLYMIWTGLACLNQFINSIVWNGNAVNWAPVWCDICR